MFVNLNAVLGRDHFLAGIDRAQPFAAIWVNQTEFELRDTRELIARFLNLCGIKPRNLNENSIVPNRTDNWFARAKVIDPCADDVDGQVEQALGHVFVSGLQPNEKVGAALSIEAGRKLVRTLRHDHDVDGYDQ